MNNTLGFPATMEKVATRSGDKSLVITLSTQELPSIQKVMLMDQVDKMLYFFFCDAQMSEQDIADAMPAPVRPKETKKPHSQRLRDVIYRIFEKGQKTDGTDKTDQDFEKYYQEIMEKIIQHYKNILSEL